MGGCETDKLTAVVLTTSSHETETMPLPSRIVDTHQHLWNMQRQNLPWLAGAPEVLRQNYGPVEYRTATAGFDVTAVYMEVDIAPDQRWTEVETVLALIRERRGATVAAVVSGPIGEDGFEEYVQRLVKHPEVRGLRRVLHSPLTPPGYCLRDRFVDHTKLLGDNGLSFDLCIRPDELGDAIQLVRKCPNTRFILDHLANGHPRAFVPDEPWEQPSHTAESWRRGIEEMAALPNVICKVSGVIASLPADWPTTRLAPLVNHCLDAFGPDRVVFGSDWPVCRLRAELREWVETLADLIATRPEADQQKLWYENAARFYRLG
jgi:L-fuconolactonase